MSTYKKETLHPETKIWENATWIDDHFGNHNYGVQFSDGKIYDPRAIELQTREGHIHPETTPADDGDIAVPTMNKERVTYRVVHKIEETSASDDDEPKVCTGRTVEALVTIELPSGAITVDKVMHGQTRGRDFHFAASDPHIVRAVGEILIAAANASKNTQDGIV